jgi:hypothetical protein
MPNSFAVLADAPEQQDAAEDAGPSDTKYVTRSALPSYHNLLLPCRQLFLYALLRRPPMLARSKTEKKKQVKDPLFWVDLEMVRAPVHATRVLPAPS